MNEIGRGIAALLVALVAASPLAAQTILPQTKPATFDRAGQSTGDSARRTFDQYAACLLGRWRKPVLEVLALPSGSFQQNQALSSLIKSECLDGGSMRFSSPIFRGSLYTALVRAQFARNPATLGPEPVDFTKEPLPGGDSPPAPDVAELLNFASCVVHKDLENARDAIVAAAGSPKEDAAMVALAKVYGLCLYSDQTLKFSKGSLIGLLAEAYYREGNAAAQHSGAP